MLVSPSCNKAPAVIISLQVIDPSTSKTPPKVETPTTSKVFVITFAVLPIPVNADPSIAGNVDGNLASGIVPELKFDAFREDPVIKPAPLVS